MANRVKRNTQGNLLDLIIQIATEPWLDSASPTVLLVAILPLLLNIPQLLFDSLNSSLVTSILRDIITNLHCGFTIRRIDFNDDVQRPGSPSRITQMVKVV